MPTENDTSKKLASRRTEARLLDAAARRMQAALRTATIRPPDARVADTDTDAPALDPASALEVALRAGYNDLLARQEEEALEYDADWLATEYARSAAAWREALRRQHWSPGLAPHEQAPFARFLREQVGNLVNTLLTHAVDQRRREVAFANGMILAWTRSRHRLARPDPQRVEELYGDDVAGGYITHEQDEDGRHTIRYPHPREDPR